MPNEGVEYIKNDFWKLSIQEQDDTKGRISYSQYSKWAECPLRWKLDKIEGLEPFTQSIHTLFGTAFHETLQTYLHVLFTDSTKAADNLNLNNMLRDNMVICYKDATEQMGHSDFTYQTQMEEFLKDGIAILEWFKKKRTRYFSTRHHELMAIEMPIYYPASEKNHNVMMLGYLDVVIRDKRDDTYKIIDIKTSGKGWSKWQKKDDLKKRQLVLYKHFLSKQIGIDIDKIDVEFFIVRRTIDPDSMYPIPRIQEFSPPTGKVTVNKALKSIDDFVTNAFNRDGSKNVNGTYPAIKGERNKHCKFCPHVDNFSVCPKENRKTE